jgi:glucose-6-phosphate dehydrogenase assembly protein OpcA
VATASVHPDAILKELGKLWIDLGKQNPETGVLRACAMTFIVVAAEEDDPQVFGETVAELTHENPSRAIILRVCCPGDERLESRVYAQCWKPFGRQQQICSEVVEISASPEHLSDVPQIILGLTVPDLPIVVWSRSPDFIQSSNVDGLLARADKVIVDSARIPDPEQGLAYVKALRSRGINVGDLAWTRMSPWRQSVAQIFEEAGRPKLQKVRITYYKQSPSVSGRYLAAWFRQAVPGLAVKLEPAPDTKRRSIFLEAEGLQASVEVEGSTALLTVNGLTRQSAVPDRDDAALLREELAILGQDTTFRKVIQSAE